jgi:hypothetical protein
MVKKINIVTKRLVDHNEKIRKQNLRIRDKENVYVDIKAVLRRLPGLETPEEKKYYEVLYEAKKQQLATMKHEIYANEAQTAFFRKQVVQLDNRLKELKSDYFAKMDAQFCLKSKEKRASCKRRERRSTRRTDPEGEEEADVEKESFFAFDATETRGLSSIRDSVLPESYVVEVDEKEGSETELAAIDEIASPEEIALQEGGAGVEEYKNEAVDEIETFNE